MKNNPKISSTFIHWKHLFDFHDHELMELALNVLERVPDEIYKVTKTKRVL
jgi:hypothetical protein